MPTAEVGSQNQVGSRKSEVGSQESEYLTPQLPQLPQLPCPLSAMALDHTGEAIAISSCVLI